MVRCAVVFTALYHAVAWPGSLQCNYDCMAQYTPGSAFGQMYVANIGATSGDTCKITTNIPQDGYAPDSSYTVTITSLVPLAQKLTSSSGRFGSLTSTNAGTKETSHSHVWTSPSDLSGSVSFRALCGDSQEMWYAAEVSANIGAGPFTTTTTTSGSTTTSVASNELPLGVAIGTNVHMYAEVSDDSVDIQVTGATDGWLGMGFSEGSSVSMIGGSGGGSDTFICSELEVKRYWITSYSVPSGGVAVPGSSCSVISGKTVMRFQRALTADATQVQMTPGTSQMVIWAYGTSAQLSPHTQTSRGGSLVDFETLSAQGVSKEAGAALFLHLIFMAMSWGMLLPWGVAIANRTKNVTNAAPGGWFKWHKKLQIIGWFVQLVGFGMAVWHVQENSIHFSGLHHMVGLVVVIFGTSQPFNAMLRKTCAHPHPGEAKSTGRFIWEVMHKGLGYFATIFGLLNCWVGVMLLVRGGYSVVPIAVAASLSGLGTASVIGYVILSLINKDNCISKGLVASKHADKSKEESSDEPVTAYNA
eukprot:symbB.v1.2.012120.t1/scaffold830.1/size159233/13